MLDHDADGDQELVLSLGSPYRGFAILDLDSCLNLKLQNLYKDYLMIKLILDHHQHHDLT